MRAFCHWLLTSLALVVAADAAQALFGRLRGRTRPSKRQEAIDAGGDITDSSGLPTANWLRAGRAHKPFMQELENDGDTSYFAPMTIGGQTVNALFDTGSHDILTFSTHCDSCGDIERLYDENKSSTFESGDLMASSSYGSGTAVTRECFERMRVGPMEVHRQWFWEALSAEMPVLEQAEFQMIFGMGPPDGGVVMAEQSAKRFEEMAPEIEEQLRAEAEIVGASEERLEQALERVKQVVQETKDKAEHVREATYFLEAVNVNIFSACFGPRPGSKGLLVWNDVHPQSRSEEFVAASVTSNMSWSAELQQPRLGQAPNASQPPVGLGCHDKPCTALVDTGTSLLAVPQHVVDKVYAAVDLLDLWHGANANCSNLTGLPDLEFELGGQRLSLPPSSYMAEMFGMLPPSLHDAMPRQLAELRQAAERNETNGFCMPLLMGMDIVENGAPLWILGAPFLRKYYTTFLLDGLQGKQMFFAEADDQCQPMSRELLNSGGAQHHPAPRVDASKLRVPRVLLEGRKSSTALLQTQFSRTLP